MGRVDDPGNDSLWYCGSFCHDLHYEMRSCHGIVIIALLLIPYGVLLTFIVGWKKEQLTMVWGWYVAIMMYTIVAMWFNVYVCVPCYNMGYVTYKKYFH